MAATNHAQAMKEDTKEAIATALLQLLSRQNLSNLTVSQVCQRAGVSRMAFYRNFDGLDRVLHGHFQPKIAKVFETIRKDVNLAEKIDEQVRFFGLFGDDLLAAIEKGYEPLIQEIFVEEIQKSYTARGDGYWVVFMASGVYAIWKKWLQDGQTIPLTSIARFFRQLDSLNGVVSGPRGGPPVGSSDGV